MFYRLRAALMRFMAGRYGPDSFGNFLLVSYIIVWILFSAARLFVGGIPAYILSLLQTALFIYILFRMLSRNIYKRQRENAKYFALKNRFMRYFRLKRDIFRTRKTNIWKKCPHCKAMIKLPRKKGKHTCTCPKCRRDFKVRVILDAKRT